nr:MAG TPA: hypothetical protein [Bacteriophage sp.]
MPVKSVTLYPVELPDSPCGLSRVQPCARVWRCVECECGLRCFEYVCVYRLASGNLINRRTAPGTCPRSGAEGSKPQQQHPLGWKAEKSRVGWSLVGCYQFEEVRSGERKALIFHVY